MKDIKVRKYIKRVLGVGITAAAALAVLALIFGGAWGYAAVGAILLLPISRLSSEIYGFIKERKPGYAVISAVLVVMIGLSFLLALLARQNAFPN